MNSGIFISFYYNAREMEGIEEFQKELDQEYLCQGIGKWIPSCSEGGEMWITLNVVLPIAVFLAECFKDVAKEAVINTGKRYVLEPFKRAFRGLRKNNDNKWGLKLQTCTFKFNDLEIQFGGLKHHELESIEDLLGKVYEVKKRLDAPLSFPVVHIALPAEQLPQNGKYCIDTWRFDNDDLFGSLWIITYADNHKTLYNPSDGKEYEMR